MKTTLKVRRPGRKNRKRSEKYRNKEKNVKALEKKQKNKKSRRKNNKLFRQRDKRAKQEITLIAQSSSLSGDRLRFSDYEGGERVLMIDHEPRNFKPSYRQIKIAA